MSEVDELTEAISQSRIALRAFGALPPGVAAHLIDQAEKAAARVVELEAATAYRERRDTVRQAILDEAFPDEKR